MKELWIAVLLCAGALLVLASVLPADQFSDRSGQPLAGENSLQGPGQDVVAGLFAEHNGTRSGNRSALFSKDVAAGTRYIVVSLYSGDITDPISVTIITPDRTLGPFFDNADGSIDGRIDLKISNPETVTPGLWKFLIHSNKNIAYGSLENLSWIRTGTGNHNADE